MSRRPAGDDRIARMEGGSYWGVRQLQAARRSCVVLTAFRERAPDRYLQKTTNTLEVEGLDKPGMVADWLVLWFRELTS